MSANPWAQLRWYLSPGVERPPHIPHVEALRLAAPVGPDDQAGTCYGGPYSPETRDKWLLVRPGVFVLPGDSTPQACQRLELSPRIAKWAAVPGCRPGDTWLVPVLLTPVDPQDLAKGSRSALDPIWRGGDTWDGAEWAPYQQRLRQILALRAATLSEIASLVVPLACDLISATHHLTADEVAALGWFSERVLIDYLYALADMLPPVESELLSEVEAE